MMALLFSFCSRNSLVSSSHDQFVKFWSIDTSESSKKRKNPDVPQWTLYVPQAPVWKVRYTPFGEGLVTLVMPTRMKEELSLMLWNAER